MGKSRGDPRRKPGPGESVRVEKGVFRIGRADGSTYLRIEFLDQHGGRRREEVLGGLKEARDLYADRRREVKARTYESREDRKAREERERKAAKAERVTVGEFVERFHREHPGKRRSDHYAITLSWLVERFGDRAMRDVTRADLDLWGVELLKTPTRRSRHTTVRGENGTVQRVEVPGRLLGPSSVRKILTATVRLFRMAKRWGVITENPCAEGLTKPAEPKPKTAYLDREAYARVEAEAPPWLRPMMRFAVQTGMRLGEVTLLRWEDVDLRAGIVSVPADTKTEACPVPLNATARAVVEERRAARVEVARAGKVARPPLFVFFGECGADYSSRFWRNKIATKTRAAMHRAGVAGGSFHMLRHTAASWMAQAGVPLFSIGAILGHSTPAMTQWYSHLSPDHLRGAVAALDSVEENDTKTTQAAEAASATNASVTSPLAKPLPPQ